MSSTPGPVGRTRIGLGLASVTLALVAASALAGFGFAGTSPSAAQYQYGKTVAICHHTKSKKHPWVNLRINIRAWPGHLQHGDTFGACTQAQLHPKPKPPKPTPPTGKGKGHQK